MTERIGSRIGEKWKKKMEWLAQEMGMSQTAVLRQAIDILEREYKKSLNHLL